mmetsp:Transcript_66030/g.156483  ORF Transcript_66030/g.156483 Transcript_66030/m.156483 type:complete len:185 (-) Transcript_66030:181-735(-)
MGNRGSQLLPQSERKVAHHLSAAKNAERHVVAQRKFAKEQDPKGKMWEKDEDLFTQMHKLADSITDRPELNATPPGAVNKNAKRKLAGQKIPGEMNKLPAYGVSEPDLRSLLFAAVHETKPGEVPNAAKLAAQFELKEDQVEKLLFYICPSMPIANSNLAQEVSARSFFPRASAPPASTSKVST